MKTCGTCKHWQCQGKESGKCKTLDYGMWTKYYDLCCWHPTKWEPLLMRRITDR